MGLFEDAHSTAVSVGRYGRGWFAKPGTGQPKEPLVLYEFEACPFCRKVREAFSELDLAYVCHPSARGSAHRPTLLERGGKEQFPYLIDPNTGTELYESEDIIDYLYATYAASPRGAIDSALSPLNTLTAATAGFLRPYRGARTTGRPEQPPERLILYNFEASPYCRKVRETLAELDLVHEARNVAKRGVRRPELIERGGKMMVPYLIDPNTGTEMYESDDIVEYLRSTYAL
jgi:glutathione S-transferase